MMKLKLFVPLILTVVFISGCSVIEKEKPAVNNSASSACGLSSAAGKIMIDSPCPGSGVKSEYEVIGKVEVGDIVKVNAEFFAGDAMVQTKELSLKGNLSTSFYKSFLETIVVKAKGVTKLVVSALDANDNEVDHVTVELIY